MAEKKQAMAVEEKAQVASMKPKMKKQKRT